MVSHPNIFTTNAFDWSIPGVLTAGYIAGAKLDGNEEK